METKTCNRCKQELPIQKFNTRKERGKVYLQSRCRACKKQQARDAGWNNPETAKLSLERKLARVRARREDNANRARFILTDAKSWDKKAGLVSDLDEETVTRLIEQPCSYCGETDLPMTLDRIDNVLGHTAANVVGACYRCNMTRGSMPHQAWIFVAEGMARARAAGAFGDWRSRPIRKQ